MSDYEHILVEIEDGVGILTLNRPEKLNTLNPDISRELGQAIDQALENREVNAILLSGEGRAFCAGFDFGSTAQTQAHAPAPSIFDHWLRMQQIFHSRMKLWDSPKPVVCAVQGYCLGDGFELTNLADLVVASDDAVFGQPEIRYSVMNYPLTLWLVGLRRTKEMMMLGETFDAPEAYRIGLVNRVVPRDQLDAEASRVAEKLARMPAETMRILKYMFSRASDLRGLRDMFQWGMDLFLINRAFETNERKEFDRIAKEQGVKAALHWAEQHFDK